MPKENTVVIDIKMKGGGGGDDPPNSSKKNSMKPKYSRFTQQDLPACKPILTPGLVIASFTLVGILFLPLGVASLFASQSVVEIVDRYDNDCLPSNYRNAPIQYIWDYNSNKTCTRKLTVPKLMKSPVFVYYQLDNFYQNHRRYVRSRNDKQFNNKMSEGDVSSCEPEARNNGKAIVPCGLVAWSLFNDTYGFKMDDKALFVDKKNIAWKSDKDHKFGSDIYPKNFQTGGLIGGKHLNASIPLSEQEDLMVWMRTAALPTFRKLYGRIERDLEANDIIEVDIENNYNSYGYGGKKKLVLSTTTWIGGKNDFIGIAYLLVGSLNLFFAFSFILIYVFKPRPLGDPTYLTWNRQPN
ncbi:ALA-interacting subunit 5-like [Euphorbia lathyris]|uniref:ALA-interacting subunit 5-like n=1 Tax=Euphorbia lathyris TaxID=212925 RepID=UPI0033134835